MGEHSHFTQLKSRHSLSNIHEFPVGTSSSTPIIVMRTSPTFLVSAIVPPVPLGSAICPSSGHHTPQPPPAHPHTERERLIMGSRSILICATMPANDLEPRYLIKKRPRCLPHDIHLSCYCASWPLSSPFPPLLLLPVSIHPAEPGPNPNHPPVKKNHSSS